jgi:hypothetical protein
MRGKLEKVPTSLIFNVYWVSILMVVKISNFPTHSIAVQNPSSAAWSTSKTLPLEPLIE